MHNYELQIASEGTAEGNSEFIICNYEFVIDD